MFSEGRLFAWVHIVIHQRELGGIFPPIKLLEAGKVRG